MQTHKVPSLHIGIHQVPKSKWKLILFALQHVLAMFGANILVPLLVNSAANEIVIPLQVAFFSSGVGTIIYLFITGFRTPIYLGSSFAFLGGMTTLYVTTGYNIFFSLMIVGFIYIIVAMIIFFTKKAYAIKKLLSPIIVGPAIMMIGWGMISNAAKDSYLNPANFNNGVITSSNIGNLWALISIGVVTFIVVIIAIVFLKGIWKMLPILLGLVGGTIFSVIVWSIAKGVGNSELANILYGDQNKGVSNLLDVTTWKWYPDITHMWRTNSIHDFKIEAYLSLVPLVIVTMAEHVGDHINLGHLTGHDFISGKPGIYRTLIGDGLATIVSASMGGPANTSYGENTSVIALTKVASVWVIFLAAIFSIMIAFMAPISMILNVIPTAVIGGIEIILFSMIAINGLRIIINAKIDMFKPKNIIIISILALTGLGGAVLVFVPADIVGSQVSIAGTGVGIVIAILLNLLLPDSDEDKNYKQIEAIDFAPSDFARIKTMRKTKDYKNNELYNLEQPFIDQIKKKKKRSKKPSKN